jgi:ubiquinone/menaquinone biosynthesis C-methylase UbiE
MLKFDPKERFSSRAENYARFRPTYPLEVVEVLKNECGLTSNSVIADIASGTGIFTRLLLENGIRVLGVEPNAEMRRAGEEYLANYPKFTSVTGTAENTGLPDQSVDLVTAAQAAHWFDREKALREIQRILKQGGYLALLWNDRRLDATAFDREYERMLVNYGTDYADVKRLDNETGKFFGTFKCELRVLQNFQDLDYAAFEGRLLSSSYAPQPGHPSHAPMLAELRRIFEACQTGGKVRMEYDTKLYFGQLVE